MLIEFRVKNFASIRDETVFSMLASDADKKDKVDSNVMKSKAYGNLRLLKSAAIYGPNASGKSNLLKAIYFMKLLVMRSMVRHKNDPEWSFIIPFLLDDESKNHPTLFEVNFIGSNQERYVYGFEMDSKAVYGEWLYNYRRGRKRVLFERASDNSFTVNNLKTVKSLIPKEGVLFISAVSTFESEEQNDAHIVSDWFENQLSFVTPYRRDSETIEMLKDERKRHFVLELLQKADFGIVDVEIEEIEVDIDQRLINAFKEITEHEIDSKFHKDDIGVVREFMTKAGKLVRQVMDFQYESLGTEAFFNLCGPFIECLLSGGVLVIDELDCNLHTHLTLELINAFNSVKNKSSQLVFNTHDLLLIQQKIFRRDQIWFTDKSKDQATDLYSLAELKVRKDESYAKSYMVGKYGAVPFIHPSLFEEILH